MERLITGLLRRSSDAVVIIGLVDGRVLDVNEAFFTATGHARHELVGRLGREVFIGLGQPADPTAREVLQNLGSIADVSIGLWNRSGELRVGDLSALVLELEGRRDALCMIRNVRDPTPDQRHSVAREELDRILRSGDRGPGAATKALRAVGRSLRWELGALWRGTPRSEQVRCAAVWRSPQANLGRLEETLRDAAVPPGLEPLRRVLLREEPIWIPDILADSNFPQGRVGDGEPMHGWLGFPAFGSEGVIGMVELVSRETRQPDPELLEMIQHLGHVFGRLLEDVREDVRAPDARVVEEAETVHQVSPGPAPGTVSTAIRDLAGAVAATTEALERHPAFPAHVSPPALLDELTAGMGRLNRLLENAAQQSGSGPPAPEPSPPSDQATVQPPPALPTGLTLKAVSQRTGIPAATLRTWENRYGFMRPRRSPGGYRLYGEEEIARIEQVKYLVGQGVRIGAAMKAVIEEAGGDELTDGVQQSAAQDRPEERGKHAAVYRVSARSPRTRPS
jgi:DNA-binding transcriptional MerR regulator/PAS domain-containing protein